MENTAIQTAKVNTGQMAIFNIGDETFGISINIIKEIVRVPELTIVPNAPPYLAGLTNLRNHVLPIINARIRLGLPTTKTTDNTRILVIETGNTNTGIIVDKVKGVVSLENMTTEEPPDIVSNGIDKKYIKAVIKSANQDKIIMEFDAKALCAMDMIVSKRAGSDTYKIKESEKTNEDLLDETKMVTFLLSNEEYGFPIEIVNEVLRVGNITKIPNTHDYIVGVLTVRNTVLPIVDMRKIFGMKSLEEELYQQFDFMDKQKKQWLESYKQAIDNNVSFKGNLIANKSLLGDWIDHFRTVSKEIGEVIQDLRYINLKLYENATELMKHRKEMKQSEQKATFEKDIMSIYNQLGSKFEGLRDSIKAGIYEDQRIMVVDFNRTSVGVLVDRVQQVLRVPRRVMETPPGILSTKKSKALQSIAKLNEGKRIVLLLNQKELIDSYHIQELADINKENDMEKQSTSIADVEEIQLVTFNLGNEQFAIGIDEVKEINRIDMITSIPQAASFILGVMNLRGNVIPVIDLRTRFGLPARKIDHQSRVIIVNLLNKLTGLVVDSVSEVLRMPKNNIEPTPDIMQSDLNTDFLRGVCKLDKARKMLMLIAVDKILSKEQKNEFLKTTGAKKESEIEVSTELTHDQEDHIEQMDNEVEKNIENKEKKSLKKAR